MRVTTCTPSQVLTSVLNKPIKSEKQAGGEAHAFNPSTQEAEVGRSLESEVSLIYRVSRMVRAAQRNLSRKTATKMWEAEKGGLFSVVTLGIGTKRAHRLPTSVQGS